MAHEVETMAYAGELPWHGLGNEVDPNVTTMEMLEAAGLKWKVEKRPLFMQSSKGLIQTSKFALVRETDEKVLTFISDDWNPVQNETALNFFKDYCEAGQLTLETAGSLRGGKVIWALAKLNVGFTLNGNDVTNGYVLLTSHHEVGHCTSVRTVTIRVVCANTMAMALRSEHDLHWYQNHLSEFDVNAAKAAVEQSHELLALAHEQATILNGINLTELEIVQILAPFFQPTEDWQALVEPANQNKHLSAVLASVNFAPGAAPNTGWGVLQGVTHWADHVAGRETDARLNNAWFGKNAALKLQVNKKLLELAA